MTDAVKKLFEMLIQKEKSGSDYTGKVTNVDGNMAYVQFDGSDIPDTPVLMSIGASPGDSVRVRVADGKAWLTGNDSAPPNDSANAMKSIEATNAHIKKIETENIVGENGWINLKEGKFAYGGNSLTWNGKLLKVNGSIQTNNGTIGEWNIDQNGLQKTITSGNNQMISKVTISEIMVSSVSGNNASTVGMNPSAFAISDGTISGTTFTPTKNTALTTDGVYTTGYVMAGGTMYEQNTALSLRYAPISNSDPVLKKNIAKSKLKAIDLIKRITMRAFDWKGTGKHWDVGFIAPELHEIDPNMADPPTGENGSYWSVNSFYMVGVLTKALQEQQEQLELLEEQLRNLETLCIERINQ